VQIGMKKKELKRIKGGRSYALEAVGTSCHKRSPLGGARLVVSSVICEDEKEENIR